MSRYTQHGVQCRGQQHLPFSLKVCTVYNCCIKLQGVLGNQATESRRRKDLADRLQTSDSNPELKCLHCKCKTGKAVHNTAHVGRENANDWTAARVVCSNGDQAREPVLTGQIQARGFHHASSSGQGLHELLTGLRPCPCQDDPTPQHSCRDSLLVVISVKGLDHEGES